MERLAYSPIIDGRVIRGLEVYAYDYEEARELMARALTRTDRRLWERQGSFVQEMGQPDWEPKYLPDGRLNPLGVRKVQMYGF